MVDNNRVLLVYPSNPMNDQPDRPPLSILTVAAPLVDKGMEVCLLDERAEPDFDTRLAEEIEKKPLCVGISSLSGRHIRGALRVSRLVKYRSDIPVVWGGVHPSLEPKSTIRHELVDLIVRDDGEETFPKVLECLKHKSRRLHDIPGIGFKENGQVVLTGVADPARIEDIPLLPFHLLDLSKYHAVEPWTSDTLVFALETSRGCPFRCSFCTESVRKKKWRALSPERVVSNIKHYKEKYNVHSFTFIDDNIFGNINRGKKLIELMAREDLGIEWHSNIRTDFMSQVEPDFIRKLEKSGCRHLTFGAESGSERILNMVSKHASTSQVIQTNRKLAGSKILPHFVTIRGFPGEKPQETIQTILLNIQLLLENRRTIIDSPFLIPTPGTKIGYQCLGEEIHSYTLEDWSKIFDFEKEKQCNWLEEETLRILKQYGFLQKITSTTNRPSTSGLVNAICRFSLRGIRTYLAWRYLNGRPDLYPEQQAKD